MPTLFRENNGVHRHAPPRFMSRCLSKLLLFFLKSVIMLVAMSLFFIFFCIAAIVLFNYLVMSKAFNRRCFHPDEAVEAEPEPEPEPRPDIEAVLPGLPYVAANFPEKSDCAICLDCFREGDTCRKIPICKHLFHAECVDRWIGENPTCPVCRTRVDLDPPGIGGGDRRKRLRAVIT